MIHANVGYLILLFTAGIAAGFLNIPTLVIFAWKGDVFWQAGICLALGNAIGGWCGASFSIKKGETYIRSLLNVLLTIFIIKLLFLS